MSRETKRFLIKFIAVIVAVVAILYIVLSVYRKSWNPVKWFDTPQTNIETENQTQNTQSGLVSPKEVEMNGIKIAAAPISPSLYDTYAVPMAAETALTLTITPTPEDAELMGGKFTIAFKNASSAWATGKSVATYVTLSQSTVKQATVSCLKAFGEPIVITYTVKGENGANKTATYQLDYRARIVSIEDTYMDTPYNNSSRYLTGYDFSDIGTVAGVLLNYSDYTVKENFTIKNNSMNFSVNAEFLSACTSKGIQFKQTKYSDAGVITAAEERGDLDVQLDINDVRDLFFGADYYAAAYRTVAFRDAMKQVGSHFDLDAEITDSYSTFKLHATYKFDASTLDIAAQSVQFSGGSQHTF